MSCTELTCPHHGEENRRKVRCDHPGLDHDGMWSYCWPCPKCGICKFIGHGPLCGDCYSDEAERIDQELADLIVDMLNRRTQGVLKKSGDDFISGLIRAYAVVIGVASVDDALTVAKAKSKFTVL